jgi:PEP-CTERM motif
VKLLRRNFLHLAAGAADTTTQSNWSASITTNTIFNFQFGGPIVYSFLYLNNDGPSVNGIDNDIAPGQSSGNFFFNVAPASDFTLFLVNDINGGTTNVSFSSAVPEPSTWAMMLIGFAGLGFAFRQSRRKVSMA